MTRVVLVHGAGGGPELWTAVAGKLAAYDPEALALPGHRDGGPGRDSLEGYAAWLVERIEARGPAVLVGSSMGAAIALLVALDRPDLVDGLVLAGAAARLRVAPSLLASLEADDYPAAARDIAARELAPGTDPRTIARSAALIQRVPRAVTLADFRACDGFDVSARLGQVRAPSLVIVGEHDTFTPPAQARRLAEGLPRAELELLPGAGHLPMVERPRRVADAITRFVEGPR